MTDTRRCQNCEGTGSLILVSNRRPVNCDICGGRGSITVAETFDDGKIYADRLTPEQVATGLHEARRIITNAAGYYMADEMMPFDAHFKLLALAAIERLALPTESVAGETPDTEKVLSAHQHGVGVSSVWLTQDEEDARDLTHSLQVLAAFTGTMEAKAYHVTKIRRRIERLCAALTSERSRADNDRLKREIAESRARELESRVTALEAEVERLRDTIAGYFTAHDALRFVRFPTSEQVRGELEALSSLRALAPDPTTGDDNGR